MSYKDPEEQKDYNREYMREYRARNGNARGRDLNKAHNRALRSVAKRYPGVFAKMLHDECIKMGIEPPKKVGRPA